MTRKTLGKTTTPRPPNVPTPEPVCRIMSELGSPLWNKRGARFFVAGHQVRIPTSENDLVLFQERDKLDEISVTMNEIRSDVSEIRSDVKVLLSNPPRREALPSLRDKQESLPLPHKDREPEAMLPQNEPSVGKADFSASSYAAMVVGGWRAEVIEHRKVQNWDGEDLVWVAALKETLPDEVEAHFEHLRTTVLIGRLECRLLRLHSLPPNSRESSKLIEEIRQFIRSLAILSVDIGIYDVALAHFNLFREEAKVTPVNLHSAVDEFRVLQKRYRRSSSTRDVHVAMAFFALDIALATEPSENAHWIQEVQMEKRFIPDYKDAIDSILRPHLPDELKAYFPPPLTQTETDIYSSIWLYRWRGKLGLVLSDPEEPCWTTFE